MAGQRVLVVEDDPRVAAMLVGGLHEAGFVVELATDGESALKLALGQGQAIDVVLLDLMMPGRDGFQILDDLQGRCAMPVIVVSARTDLRDRLRSFRSGAMDFVPKPFWIEEVVARIRRLTGPTRPDSATAGAVRWADAVMDLDARSVTVDGGEVVLTRYQFDLLSYLIVRPGRAVSREALARHALAPGGGRDERTIDSHIVRIRKKLGAVAGAYVQTVWGIGYRFEAPGGRDA